MGRPARRGQRESRTIYFGCSGHRQKHMCLIAKIASHRYSPTCRYIERGPLPSFDKADGACSVGLVTKIDVLAASACYAESSSRMFACISAGWKIGCLNGLAQHCGMHVETGDDQSAEEEELFKGRSVKVLYCPLPSCCLTTSTIFWRPLLAVSSIETNATTLDF